MFFWVSILLMTVVGGAPYFFPLLAMFADVVDYFKQR